MCMDCHTLYDDGIIWINNGKIQISNIKEYPEYKKLNGKTIASYNELNKKYFDYHYKNIYLLT